MNNHLDHFLFLLLAILAIACFAIAVIGILVAVTIAIRAEGWISLGLLASTLAAVRQWYQR